jgi:large subunit ribosomal protein L25
MADSVVFSTEPREGRGSQKARRLRRQGLIPAVLYGHKEETVSLAVNAEEFEYAIRHGSRVIDLKTAKGVEKALVKEIQWDHLGKHILHADFARVSEQDRVQVPVPLELRGVAPGVTAGGLLDQPLHSLEIECQATSIPESIRVNINELQIDQAIYVRDLKLPPGVVALADPDVVVVHVTQKAVEPEAAPAEVAAETAEPEVIGRQAKEEEEEGE